MRQSFPEVSDAFWNLREPLVSPPSATSKSPINAGLAGKKSLLRREKCFRQSYTPCAPVSCGKPCPRNTTRARIPFTAISTKGRRKDFFTNFGGGFSPNVPTWKVSPGNGGPWTTAGPKLRRPGNVREESPRIVGKKRTKRPFPADGHGALPPVALTGAGRHDTGPCAGWGNAQHTNLTIAAVRSGPVPRQRNS